MDSVVCMQMVDKELLKNTSNKLIQENKGILAIDESPKSMESKFSKVNIENTVENRRRYREVLLTAPQEIGKYLGGVILNEETFTQEDSQGVPFIQHITQAGICAGVKLDKGLLPLSNSDEKVSTGLDGLNDRCKQYKDKGALFAKWRSVFSIDQGKPSDECVYKNCEILAEYAVICQKNSLVPVVEPEVLFSGGHTAEECGSVTSQVISCLFYHLNKKGAYIPGVLLKVGFVTSGANLQEESVDEVASGTIKSFMSSIPPALPGIVFLSGGHSEDLSVAYLQGVSAAGAKENAPWAVSYSFGRALQDGVLELWDNKDENKEKAQNLLVERARICSSAVMQK
ncbi:fructose-bisphosphate aldolase, class I [Nematocida sp. AWRm78]|nr:fructose-bisphosphate aldolase, class I [Nematocida sp. AWRm78]